MEVNFVRWHTRKNGNDGRRESAIKWEETKIHKRKDELSTVCGRKIGAMETNLSSSEVDEFCGDEEICKKCVPPTTQEQPPE